MILRILMVIMTAIAPLSVAQASCCSKCETVPSAASLLQSLQLVLDNGLLLQPQLQPLLTQLFTTLITAGIIPVAGESYGDFFALMPGDNAATIAVGAPVLFPQTGPTSGGIVRVSDSTFLLPNIGTYQVFFQVSVDEPGQLMLSLDSTGTGLAFVEQAATVAGRATGTSQIVGMSYVTTTAPNSLIQLVNPSGNAAALTITPVAGGTHAVSAHITILQL